MTNVQYETIDEYNDLESKNYYKEALQKVQFYKITRNYPKN